MAVGRGKQSPPPPFMVFDLVFISGELVFRQCSLSSIIPCAVS